MDHGDTGGLGIFGAPHVELASVEDDLPSVGLDGAGEDPHQSRFASPILPDQGVDLTGSNIEIDVADGMHAAEPLVYLAHLQKWSLGHQRSGRLSTLMPDGLFQPAVPTTFA